MVLAALGLAQSVAAQEPAHLGFKGYELGSSVAVAAADPRFECNVATAPGADLICGLKEGRKETLGGAPLRSLFLFYHWGRLTSISAQAEEKHFPQLEDALRHRFGEGRVRSEWVKNLKDKPFENRVRTWQGEGESLVLQRFGGRLDQSSVRFAADARITDIEKQRAAAAKDPRLDL